MSFVTNLPPANTQSSEEVAEVLPAFVSSISKSSPLIFFYHIIDPETTKLTIQVLGANISFQFSHQRAKTVLSPSKIAGQLENKTVGFIAVATPQSQRIVLAAAESGHGFGKYGDVLDKKKGVLPNSVWTRRVVAMGKTLGMKMGRPFDNPHRRGTNTDGIFLGSHVEVKLAVHGICVLLKTFGITKDLDNITVEHLHKLRLVRWADGTRPVFEVYFSRKHCVPCKLLVKRLSEATGITIRLLWRDRLVKKEYVLRAIHKNGRRQGQVRDRPVFDPQDFDFGDLLPDDSDIEVISDDEDIRNADHIDLTGIRSTSPAGISAEIDDLLDGLAYRVGQMEECPEGATAAIVGFARTMSAHNRSKNLTRDINVNKPLPATPVIEAPIDVLEGGERQRNTFPRAQRSLFGRSRELGGGTRARSASPCRSRREPIRDRSPRRYNLTSPKNCSTRILERTRADSQL
ncbi:hypothetical protein FLAG1_05267 [Fusarium langsethiae]|uniref:Uncharacterized protein n=1 Tax=Fusarium langsethiae TaxID=179993 RepID=A0A0M9EXW4_FUSLA|nr:hypothetical protein FLAG1_05267 [Fusarium langsethiae]GKU02856.1 unnamed protein product [Fusarium langsethiae]GKU17781.1 unnamed protein product [Fusarium langsethiae]